MASVAQLAWLREMYDAAKAAGHKWPACAACEAAEETGWGSHIPRGSNNVLGIKAYRGWTGGVVDANGTEQHHDGTWTGPENMHWCVFDSPKDCFAEQIEILAESRYSLARAAITPERYILEECKVWSTGLLKGAAVMAIYQAHKSVLG